MNIKTKERAYKVVEIKQKYIDYDLNMLREQVIHHNKLWL